MALLDSMQNTQAFEKTSDFFYFDPNYLNQLAQDRAESYASAKPYPHAVIDGFIPQDWILHKVLEEFPSPKKNNWHPDSPAQLAKASYTTDYLYGPHTRHLMNEFNSATFIKFLQQLTGIQGLIPDPHYLGAGLHQINSGGFLKIHTDFSWYPELKLRRRLNMLLYLNEGWREEWGGAIELWDKKMKGCVKKALPLFNRCVIFNTTQTSYHGHPDPLMCPKDVSRKSIALYYYTADASEPTFKKHGTLFFGRPKEKMVYPRNFIARFLPSWFYDAAISVDKKVKKTRRPS